MTDTTDQLPPGFDEMDRRQADLPPVARLATLTLALVIVGGIYMASNYGHAATLVPAVALTAAAALVLVANIVLLVRIGDFAWDTFFLVAGWALVAYLVIAGILGFVFIYDHTPAKQLSLFLAMLALFAVDVPLLLGFSVARWQPVPGADG
ncbi:MAG: hypothetical protein ACLPVF_16755 [Acidimicrobiales bacterium]